MRPNLGHSLKDTLQGCVAQQLNVVCECCASATSQAMSQPDIPEELVRIHPAIVLESLRAEAERLGLMMDAMRFEILECKDSCKEFADMAVDADELRAEVGRTKEDFQAQLEARDVNTRAEIEHLKKANGKLSQRLRQVELLVAPPQEITAPPGLAVIEYH